MKITTLYYVTYPNRNSVLEDILFKADWCELENMFKGGLSGQDIAGGYRLLDDAKEVAEDLLHERDIIIKAAK